MFEVKYWTIKRWLAVCNLNPLLAESIWGNINTYLHFASFLDIEISLVSETQSRKTRSSPFPRWLHDMEVISALLALCEENPPITDGFPHEVSVMWNFDGSLNQRAIKVPHYWHSESESHQSSSLLTLWIREPSKFHTTDTLNQRHQSSTLLTLWIRETSKFHITDTLNHRAIKVPHYWHSESESHQSSTLLTLWIREPSKFHITDTQRLIKAWTVCWTNSQVVSDLGCPGARMASL